MAIVLILLAVGSVLAGYVGVPAVLGGSNHLEHFLAPSFGAPGIRTARGSRARVPPKPEPRWHLAARRRAKADASLQTARRSRDHGANSA